MLEPGKMEFCKECQHYEEVDQCTHSYFASPPSLGPIGSGGSGGGGGHGGGGGASWWQE